MLLESNSCQDLSPITFLHAVRGNLLLYLIIQHAGIAVPWFPQRQLRRTKPFYDGDVYNQLKKLTAPGMNSTWAAFESVTKYILLIQIVISNLGGKRR